MSVIITLPFFIDTHSERSLYDKTAHLGFNLITRFLCTGNRRRLKSFSTDIAFQYPVRIPKTNTFMFHGPLTVLIKINCIPLFAWEDWNLVLKFKTILLEYRTCSCLNTINRICKSNRKYLDIPENFKWKGTFKHELDNLKIIPYFNLFPTTNGQFKVL